MTNTTSHRSIYSDTVLYKFEPPILKFFERRIFFFTPSFRVICVVVSGVFVV
jgi:hypothetical protein